MNVRPVITSGVAEVVVTCIAPPTFVNPKIDARVLSSFLTSPGLTVIEIVCGAEVLFCA